MSRQEDTEAHRQRKAQQAAAKAERAGGVWKKTYDKARAQVVIEAEEDLRELTGAVNVAIGERGPYARIFGR